MGMCVWEGLVSLNFQKHECSGTEMPEPRNKLPGKFLLLFGQVTGMFSFDSLASLFFSLDSASIFAHQCRGHLRSVYGIENRCH